MIEAMFSITRKTLLIVCLAIIAGMLIIGLRPFNYVSPNRVSPIKEGRGLLFWGSGIAVSRGGTALGKDIFSEEPVTLEILLKPARTYNRGIPHILSLCDRTGREVVSLGQWRTYLIVRLMDSSPWMEGVQRQAGFEDLLIPGKQVLITIVFAGENMDIYADGTLVQRYTGFKLGRALADRPVRSLILGNSSLGDRHWRGEISGFSVLKAKLDDETVRDRYNRWTKDSGAPPGAEGQIILYRFGNLSGGIIRNAVGKQWDLLIPETLTPLRRQLLSLPQKEFLRSDSFYFDAAVNLFGFIPLGLYAALLIQALGVTRRILLITLPAMAGGFLSLFIEINQSLLVTRNSSITDLVFNMFGSAVGAYLVSVWFTGSESGK